MDFEFFKYQGTGNDFIIIDNRKLFFPKEDSALVAKMCHRRFGVGADGLLLLENHSAVDFKMVYYNSDGHLSSMCGNGGRCIVHFAKYLGIVSDATHFEAMDGMHRATIKETWVSLQMKDVEKIEVSPNAVFLDTGSPHHVEIVSNLQDQEVFSEGRKIRNKVYGEKGANINFVEQLNSDTFAVRTYERGVENETLSCGTGVTAVALAMFETGRTQEKKIHLQTPGGTLLVRFEKDGNVYTKIFLEGPAVQVFKGNWK